MNQTSCTDPHCCDFLDVFLNHTLWKSKGAKIHDKYRVTYVRDIRVIHLFCTHSLSRQCVPLLQLAQSQEAVQELCVEAGQRMWWILLHPAGHIIKMSGSTEIFQKPRERASPKLGQLLFRQIFIMFILSVWTFCSTPIWGFSFRNWQRLVISCKPTCSLIHHSTVPTFNDTADSVPITICRWHQCFSLSHPPFCKFKHSIMIHFWMCGALTLSLKLSTFTSTSIAHTNLLLQRWLMKCSSPCCKNMAASFSASSEAFSSCWSRASPVKNLKTIKVKWGKCWWLHQCSHSTLCVHFHPTELSRHASHMSVQDREDSTSSSGNTYHCSIIPLILLTLQELISPASNNTSMTGPECRMKRALCQATLEVL